MSNSLEVIVARIDERTKDIKGDVTELKGTCHGLSKTVNEHSTQLASIKTEIGNNHGLNKRQTIGIGGAAGFVASAIVAFVEYLKHLN